MKKNIKKITSCLGSLTLTTSIVPTVMLTSCSQGYIIDTEFIYDALYDGQRNQQKVLNTLDGVSNEDIYNAHFEYLLTLDQKQLDTYFCYDLFNQFINCNFINFTSGPISLMDLCEEGKGAISSNISSSFKFKINESDKSIDVAFTGNLSFRFTVDYDQYKAGDYIVVTYAFNDYVLKNDSSCYEIINEDDVYSIYFKYLPTGDSIGFMEETINKHIVLNHIDVLEFDVSGQFISDNEIKQLPPNQISVWYSLK